MVLVSNQSSVQSPLTGKEDAALHEEALETTELSNNTELFELQSMCQVNTKWPNVFKVKKYEIYLRNVQIKVSSLKRLAFW